MIDLLMIIIVFHGCIWFSSIFEWVIEICIVMHYLASLICCWNSIFLFEFAFVDIWMRMLWSFVEFLFTCVVSMSILLFFEEIKMSFLWVIEDFLFLLMLDVKFIWRKEGEVFLAQQDAIVWAEKGTRFFCVWVHSRNYFYVLRHASNLKKVWVF